MKSLQSQFLASKGAAITMGDSSVVQMDRIPIKKGIVRIEFLRAVSNVPQGVALKSAKGHIKPSTEKEVKLLHIWDRSDLPRMVEYAVLCPDSELKVWNIYKTPGSVSDADSWTNNAGVIVEEIAPNKRRYRCSDGIGEFDPDDLVFQLEWNVEGQS